MYNKSIFNKELNMITDKQYRNFISKCLDNVPTYFWSIPASSSGKYHPQADLDEGGLVRHTKSCVQVGLDLLQSEIFFKENDHDKDIVIGSLLLHDCLKNGVENSEHTEFLHPLYASNFIIKEFNEVPDKLERVETICKIGITCMCIESHMGKWNTSDKSNEKLPIPETELQKLVHMADYIASRKYCNMNDIMLFDEEPEKQLKNIAESLKERKKENIKYWSKRQEELNKLWCKEIDKE